MVKCERYVSRRSDSATVIYPAWYVEWLHSGPPRTSRAGKPLVASDLGGQSRYRLRPGGGSTRSAIDSVTPRAVAGCERLLPIAIFSVRLVSSRCHSADVVFVEFPLVPSDRPGDACEPVGESDQGLVGVSLRGSRQRPRLPQNRSNCGHDRRLPPRMLPARLVTATSNAFLARSAALPWTWVNSFPSSTRGLPVFKVTLREESIPLLAAIGRERHHVESWRAAVALRAPCAYGARDAPN